MNFAGDDVCVCVCREGGLAKLKITIKKKNVKTFVGTGNLVF